MGYFPDSYIRGKNKIKVELDLSSYTTKSDLEGATEVDTSKFAKEVDLTKSNIDDLGIDELKIIPVDLSKPNNEVKMMFLKRLCMINWLKMLMPFRRMILAI